MPVQVRPAVPEAASGDNRPFWAIFLCKENSPFPPFSFAFNKNTKIAKPPLSAPTGAAEDMFASSRNAISIPAVAPIVAEAATTAANAVTMMSRGPIFMTLTSFREVLLRPPRATF